MPLLDVDTLPAAPLRPRPLLTSRRRCTQARCPGVCGLLDDQHVDSTEALPALTVTGLCCLEEAAPTTGRARVAAAVLGGCRTRACGCDGDPYANGPKSAFLPQISLEIRVIKVSPEQGPHQGPCRVDVQLRRGPVDDQWLREGWAWEQEAGPRESLHLLRHHGICPGHVLLGRQRLDNRIAQNLQTGSTSSSPAGWSEGRSADSSRCWKDQRRVRQPQAWVLICMAGFAPATQRPGNGCGACSPGPCGHGPARPAFLPNTGRLASVSLLPTLNSRRHPVADGEQGPSYDRRADDQSPPGRLCQEKACGSLPRGGGQRGRTDDTYGTEILPAPENMPSGPPPAHAFSAPGGAGIGLEDGTGLASPGARGAPAKRKSTQLSTFRVNVQSIGQALWPGQGAHKLVRGARGARPCSGENTSPLPTRDPCP
ncbi:hypothetical protein JEQ12_019039 [Ovis aries]|uniref:Uncharacterized protein n=1 Tax=Ovis aries TaxID=9940 RepID=A0A836A2F2_SHEEP|nr:hypothetical protein JEQ12_019039 [Ovis aries]